MKFDRDQFIADRKKINAIVYKANDKYNKIIIKASNSVRKAHEKKKAFRLMDYLEQNRRTIESEAKDEIKKLDLSYQEEVNAESQVRRNLDDIDKKYFGHPQIPGMWDWVNGNDNWKKLLGESKMIQIKKSELKEIIREVILKENNDEYDMQVYFVKGDNVVTNISKDLKDAEKALKGHNAYTQNKFGYGHIYVCNVKSKDWDAEKITISNILRLAKDIQKIK